MSYASNQTALTRTNASPDWTLRVLVAIAAVVVFTFFAINPAYAQGLEKVSTGLQSLLTFLRTISVVVVTIAIIWAGYKFAFKSADMGEILKILGGGILIGCAAEIARFLLQ